MVMRLTQADHGRVTAAIVAAERESAGEIVTIVAARSDAYHDVGLHYAILAMLAVPGVLAFAPDAWIAWIETALLGWNGAFTRGPAMLALFAAMTLVFLIVRYALAWMPLRLALTPGRTKTRRVHRRAIELFRTGAEQKTQGRTGILIYLSIGERRAEIVADRAIHEKVEPEIWGEAMAALIDEVKAGRPGEGLALAVAKVGEVLARILPPASENPNELPDRVVEL
jgi:putative membrane protein